MKKILVVLTLLFTVVSFSQEKVKVHLTNGSQVQGKLIDSTDTSVQIQTKDENIWVFDRSSIQSIDKVSLKVSESRFYNRLSIGVLGGGNLAAPSFQLETGYALNAHLETGLGLGYEFINGWAYIPVYGQGRWNFLNSATSPFVSVIAGYELPIRNFNNNMGGLTTGASVGFSHFIGERVGITTSLGYRFSYLKQTDWWGWEDFIILQELHRFELRIGLDIK